MIKKRLHQLTRLIEDIFVFFRMKYVQNPTLKDKVLYVNFENPNLYHRYFYILLKNYQLSGYSIIYPMDFQKFRNLRNSDLYLGLIFKENKFLIIKNLPRKDNYIEIKDRDFSANYYKTYFSEGNKEGADSFHVPMSFHPLMYHKNIWNLPIEHKIRINSLFCFGNFDAVVYKTLDRSQFNILDRTQLIDVFRKYSQFKSIKSKEELKSNINTPKGSEFIFVEKSNYFLPMEDVRETLSNFRYFLCCPGVFAPLCHNLVESFSVGTVPIIQKSYADVVYPNLQHLENAIIFEDLDDLQEKIEHLVFSLSEQEYLKISNNVKEYYNFYMKPKGVVEGINRALGNKIIYLNASERSIQNYLKK